MSDATSLLTAILVTNEKIAAALETPFRKYGLSFGSFELLATVKASKGECSQAELARRLGIRPASLCEAVQAAARKGWIEQVPSPTDRRVKTVRITSAGSGALTHATRILNGLNKAIEVRLSSKNIATTVETLEEVCELLEPDVNKET